MSSTSALRCERMISVYRPASMARSTSVRGPLWFGGVRSRACRLPLSWSRSSEPPSRIRRGACHPSPMSESEES
jgi:hypothetical protein